MKRTLIYSILIFISLTCSCSNSRGKNGDFFGNIGTGGLSGVYYPAGEAISKIVNEKTDELRIRLTAESTGGSVANVSGMVNGQLSFGLVQSDRLSQAYNGEGYWYNAGPQSKLRVICALHPESVTFVAAYDSNIQSVVDLKDKVVSIGSQGSGQWQNSVDTLRAFGIDWKKDINSAVLASSELAIALQSGKIDAYFYTVGHPSGSFEEAISGMRKVHFVPIVLKDSFYTSHKYYSPSLIQIKNYPGVKNEKDVKTFGVRASFCTTTDVSEETVYLITKQLFENLDELKKLHPALAVLTKKNMLQGLAAPIHDGAMKYYKEIGLKS
ncbi:MAG: TAXI family TRAP transporter solute-binding subunit [Spirochaetales bacterium]|nr:TAXI family TRAP transporter solute-binding subunit [Spirochaetales bacterium]